MKLTPLQKDCIEKLAAADMRGKHAMLGLLLVEGIRFFYCENDPFNSIEMGKLNSTVMKEMIEDLQNEIQSKLN